MDASIQRHPASRQHNLAPSHDHKSHGMGVLPGMVVLYVLHSPTTDGSTAMKIASYNLENLFMRAVALNGKTPAEGKKVLQAHAEINAILNKDTYTPADKKRVIQLMKELRIDKKDDGGPFAILRQNRGHLVTRSKSGLQVVAD